MANLLSAFNPFVGTVVKEGFDKDEFGATPATSNEFSLWRIIWILMTIFALYLVFKCRKNPDFNMVLNVLAALCCAPFYIIYRLFIAPC